MRSHSPAGRSIGQVSADVERRPWTLPASFLASLNVSPTCHSPSAPSTATSASSGAVSSAKPARPSATSGPTICGQPPSSRARTAELSVRCRAIGARSEGQNGVDDRAPAGAAAEVGGEGAVDGVDRRAVLQRGDAHDDPWRAEAALRRPARGERLRPRVGVGQRVHGRDVTAGDPRHGRHARHPRLAVDEDRAAATLPLRAAAVLDRARAEAIAEDLEEGDVSVRDLDVTTVEAERDQEKL